MLVDRFGVPVKKDYEVCIAFAQSEKSDQKDYWEDLDKNIEKVEFYPESGNGKASKKKMLAIGEVIEIIGNKITPLIKVRFRKGEVKSMYAFDVEVMP